ncbi:MAG TPA: hypothetical protein VK654_12285 [Nitrospirota bacterium]|nr:hypothetical protein [Nitrospirota bacterium]
MFTLSGGQKAAEGTYWDISSGQRIDMDQEGVLPGDQNAKYIKASPGLILVTGPFLGLIYIIALPIMGVVTAMSLIVQKVLSVISHLVRNMVSFGWRPSESYLSGSNRKKDDPGRKDSSGRH